MKEKSDRQKERLKKAQEYIKNKYYDYNHPIRDTWSLIIDYCGEVWTYAVDTGNGLWGEAVDNGNAEWSNYVEEGNRTINETIDKKNSQ